MNSIAARRLLQSPLLPFSLASVIAIAGCGGRHLAANPPTSSSPAGEPAPTVTSTSNPSAARAPANSPRTSAPTEIPAGGYERGLASWYGVPFHGRRSANGEVYDMYKFTAAHRTLPFDTVVRVTNLDNGMQTEVRITDRGPFVEDRVIDLSLAAARAIGMVGTGTARVRLDIVASDAANFSGTAARTTTAPSATASSAGASRPMMTGPSPASPALGPEKPKIEVNEGYFTVQVGAFGARENAESLKRSLESRYHPVMIQDFEGPNGHLYRVRVGNFQSEDAAHTLAEKLAAENGLRPMVVRQDEIAARGGDHP